MTAGTSQPLFHDCVQIRGNISGLLTNYLTQSLLLSRSTFLSLSCEVGLSAAERNLPHGVCISASVFTHLTSCDLVFVVGGHERAATTTTCPSCNVFGLSLHPTLSSHPNCLLVEGDESAFPDPPSTSLPPPPLPPPLPQSEVAEAEPRYTSTTAQLKIIQP